MAARFELHLKWLGERKISNPPFATAIHICFTLKMPAASENSNSWKESGNDTALPRSHHVKRQIQELDKDGPHIAGQRN
jgi:hypothetical protein